MMPRGGAKDGKYIFKIEAAHDLKNADKVGLSDPYVDVSFRQDLGLDKDRKEFCHVKTRVIDNDLNPQWRETVVLETNKLPKDAKPNVFLFEVYDKDLVGKDFLGQVELQIDTANDYFYANCDKLTTKVMNLENRNGSEGQGTLTVVFSYEPPPMHLAAQNGDVKKLKELLKDSEINPNLSVVNNRTPLWYACRFGKTECVRTLLQDERVVIEYKCKGRFSKDKTPFSTAASEFMLNEISYETAKAFLEERRGDETLNTTDDDVAGHLINSDNYHHRERKGEYKRELRELFDLVLEARAKPVGGKTLALACKAKDPQECQYALKRLLCLEDQPKDIPYDVMVAATDREDLAAWEVLLHYRVKQNFKEKKSPKCLAQERGNQDLVKMFEAAGL